MIKDHSILALIISFLLTSQSYLIGAGGRWSSPPRQLGKLHAKKSGKANISTGQKLGKGFGSTTKEDNEAEEEINVPNPMAYSSANNLANEVDYDRTALDNASPTAPSDEITKAKEAEALFKKYGMADSRDRFGNEKPKRPIVPFNPNIQGDNRPFGEGILEKFPSKTLAQFDAILVTGAFGSLAFVVLIGIGMSASAVPVVFPGVKLGDTVEGIITGILTPIFTPALLVFFAFSITYGLFKFAQASSDDSVYKE